MFGQRRAVYRLAALTVWLVVSAYVMARGLRSPEQAWLAWVALLPLFVAIRSLRPVHAMLSGALWGLSLCLFASVAAGTDLRDAALSLALLTAIPAAYAFLGAALTRRIGFSPLVLGVTWMGVELAFEPLGLANGLLAASQSDATFVHSLAGAFGYLLVPFVVATISASLISALSHVHLGSPGRVPAAETAADDTRLTAQTFSCYPLFAIPPSQPRAPPVGPSATGQMCLVSVG